MITLPNSIPQFLNPSINKYITYSDYPKSTHPVNTARLAYDARLGHAFLCCRCTLNAGFCHIACTQVGKSFWQATHSQLEKQVACTTYSSSL
jgi:hypothetical protein